MPHVEIGHLDCGRLIWSAGQGMARDYCDTDQSRLAKVHVHMVQGLGPAHLERVIASLHSLHSCSVVLIVRQLAAKGN